MYVDGFNLYYGVLKHTQFKWLNLRSFVSAIIREQNPNSDIVRCAFYTAMTMARFASRGEQSVQAQSIYHRALLSPHFPPVEVIVSHHAAEKRLLPLCSEHVSPSCSERIRVWSLTEKKTDVRLALDAYRDAMSQKFDQIVLVSNDTDFEPLIEALAADFPHLIRGVIAPRRIGSERQVANGLRNYATWLCRSVPAETLARHQFPARVPTRKRPVFKPDHW